MSIKQLKNSNEQLDAILLCLKYWNDKESEKINNGIISHSHEEIRSASDLISDLAFITKAKMEFRDIKLALEFLSDEKLIKPDLCYENKNISGYRILYAGKVFIDNGGFVQRSLTDNQNIALEKRNEKYLRYGAIGAAIGGIGYLIWDIVKWVLDY